MPDDRAEPPFLPSYLMLMACQVPLWVGGGLLWAVFMTLLAGSHPVGALVGGLGWAFFMWLVCGNLLAVGLAWRRTAELYEPDRAVLRAAVLRTADKLWLKVLAESPGLLVLGPRRALVRFRLQQVRVTLAEDTATIAASALSLGPIRKAIQKALDQAAGR